MHFRSFSHLFLVLLCTAVGMQGCASGMIKAPKDMPTPADIQTMKELDALDDPSEIIKPFLTPFACTHEKASLPRINPEVDQIFKHARWLETKYERDAEKARFSHRDEPNHVEYQKAVWLYRLAAASGHWRASRQLAEMLKTSEDWRNNGYDSFAQRHSGSLTLQEIVATTSAEIAEDLIRRGVPYGYYLKATLLDKEYGKQGSALWYLRRAADMGNPDAQYAFFERLKDVLDADRALEFQIGTSFRKDKILEEHPEVAELITQGEIVRQIVSCAADQGHGEAAYALGDALQGAAIPNLGIEPTDVLKDRYGEAAKYFQIAVKAGKAEAAKSLVEGFSNEIPNLKEAERLLVALRASQSKAENQREAFSDFMSFMNMGIPTFLNLPQDKERSGRYEKIMKILFRNRFLEPTVDELDTILPLPPGKLPQWDGEINWVKRLEKNEAPPLPSEQRIAGLARAKGIEPSFEPKLTTGQLLQLPFTCTHEKDRLSPLDPEVEMLYRHANWLYKKGGSDPCNCDPKVLRFYRIAGAWGHKEALQHFVTELEYFHSDGDIPLSLYLIDAAEKQIQRGIPYGYFVMGRVLESGEGEAWRQKRQVISCDQDDDECEEQAGDDAWAAYVKRQDEALRYFRKAADLGSPEAQSRLLKELWDRADMLQCAAEQRYGEAVTDYAEMEMDDPEKELYNNTTPTEALEKLNSARQVQRAGNKGMADKDFAIVLKYLKASSENGNWEAIAQVLEGFIKPSSGGSKNGQSLFEGEEGQEHLFLILIRLGFFLNTSITIDEIDRVLRLPIAELRLKDVDETTPPPLPSEERIKEMACAQGLDPETGLPLQTGSAQCVK